MANRNPNDSKDSENPDPNNPKSKTNIPEWLRTDDWLQITPPPIRSELPDSPSGPTPISNDQNTDMIELEDEDGVNIDAPPSTMLFSDPDDSVILNDDLPSSGPLSGKLKTGLSSIKLPRPTGALPPGSSSGLADESIDLGAVPEIDIDALAGPGTSDITRSNSATGSEAGMNTGSGDDAIGGHLKPTVPGSGWLQSATKLPEVQAPGSKSRIPSAPSTGNVNPTWAELDRPSSKAQPSQTQPESARSAPQAHPDSWHPSSGNIGIPSVANIDLPPAESSSSDIFSKASRPGAGPVRVEIPKPKPVAKSEDPKPAPTPIPASPGFELPSTPDLPPAQPKGSWHPSSGNLNLPSVGEIDLPPPADGSDIFSTAKNPAKTPPPRTEQSTAPTQPSALPVAPSLSTTNFEILPESLTPAGPSSGSHSQIRSTAAPAVPVGLEPTSDFKSSADIDLPIEPSEGASDIFSTASKTKLPNTTGGSGIFSGAAAPDSHISMPLSELVPGESNLLEDLPTKTQPQRDAGRVDLTPPDLEATEAVQVNPLLPGSKSGAINFALPGKSAGDSRASSIEIVDTSEPLEPGQPTAKSASVPSDNLLHDDLIDSDSKLEAELSRELSDDDDDGRPDFNILPSMSPSDSNILGDRTLVERSLSGPHSSSVNLADPNAFSNDPAVDSGPPSSIFNKTDQSSNATGHVDLDEIPIMGSSDSGQISNDPGRSSVLGGRLDEPHGADLEESVFDVAMPKDEAADSGMIDWSADAAKVTDRLGMQSSMEASRRSELSAGSDQPSLPTVPRRSTSATRPTSQPDLDLGEETRSSKPSKSRNAILVSALSLLAGTGIGAGAMFLTGGGTAETKADPTTIAALNDAKAKIATIEQAANDAKKEANVQKALAEANAAAAMTAKQLADEKKKLETDILAERNKASTIEQTAKKLNQEKTALLADIKKANEDVAKLMALANDAKKDAEEKSKQLDSAKLAAEAATSKLKAADGLLDPVLEKLKAAKLIDEKADREKALASIPDAIKKANLIAGEGEVAKLAKELTDTRELLKKQKDDADKKLALSMEQLAQAKKEAEKQLQETKAAADKSMADLQAKLDASDKRLADEVKKAVAAATKDAEQKLIVAQENLAKQQQAARLELQREATARMNDAKQFEARLAEQAEQFVKQLAAARAGAEVPLSDVALAKSEQAASAYDRGTASYFSGQYAEAESRFAEAAKANPADARYWYFLGLSKFALGKTSEAVADFKTGAEWESRAKPGRRVIASALERIQGPARQALESARP